MDTAKTQGQINNPNVVSPYGTQTTTWDNNFDPQKYLAANPDVAKDPRWSQNPLEHWTAYGKQQGRQGGATDTPTLTQTFSPAQQALYDQSTETKGLIGGLGEQGARALQGIVGTKTDFSGLPAGPGSAEETRLKVINAMMGRADEDYEKRTDQSHSDLIDRGIPVGSKAYGDAQQMIERSRNDARNMAEISGGNAAAQDFGMDSQRRQQAITEYLAGRQTPLNEVSALMSGSQVSNPFSAPGYAQNTNIAPAPLFAANEAAGQYGTDVYNQGVSGANANKSGLFGLGGAGLMAGGIFL